MMNAAIRTDGCVYWMGSACGRYVKLGYSSKSTPYDRFEIHRNLKSKLQCSVVIAYVSGRFENEKWLKNHFRPFLRDEEEYGAEVFHLEPLMPYLLWLRQQWFALHDPDGRTVPDRVLFTEWEPNESRQSTARREIDLTTYLDAQESPWWFLSDEVADYDSQYISPVEYLTAARETIGGTIDLDPASDGCANRYVQATNYFNEAVDGLKQPWYGPNQQPTNIWLSVPFSDLERWLIKLVNERHRGHVDQAILHAQSRMLGNDYFQPWLDINTHVCFVNKNCQFGGKGAKMPSTQERQILIYFGDHADRFKSAIKQQGLGPIFRLEAKQ